MVAHPKGLHPEEAAGSGSAVISMGSEDRHDQINYGMEKTKWKGMGRCHRQAVSRQIGGSMASSTFVIVFLECSGV